MIVLTALTDEFQSQPGREIDITHKDVTHRPRSQQALQMRLFIYCLLLSFYLPIPPSSSDGFTFNMAGVCIEEQLNPPTIPLPLSHVLSSHLRQMCADGDGDRGGWVDFTTSNDFIQT